MIRKLLLSLAKRWVSRRLAPEAHRSYGRPWKQKRWTGQLAAGAARVSGGIRSRSFKGMIIASVLKRLLK
jgi:hypothetical protein